MAHHLSADAFTAMSEPDCFIVFGLEWPGEQTAQGTGEAAVAVAPSCFQDAELTPETAQVVDLCQTLARGQGHRVVFISDISAALGEVDATWDELDTDWETVMDELLDQQVICRYLTITDRAHALLCWPGVPGFQAGGVRLTVAEREQVRAMLTDHLAAEWPPYAAAILREDGFTWDATEPVVAPARSAAGPSWHPDPRGLFPRRWWDGLEWTSHVQNQHGEYIEDPRFLPITGPAFIPIAPAATTPASARLPAAARDVWHDHSSGGVTIRPIMAGDMSGYLGEMMRGTDQQPVWLGGGAAAMGLTGPATAEDLRAVFERGDVPPRRAAAPVTGPSVLTPPPRPPTPEVPPRIPVASASPVAPESAVIAGPMTGPEWRRRNQRREKGEPFTDVVDIPGWEIHSRWGWDERYRYWATLCRNDDSPADRGQAVAVGAGPGGGQIIPWRDSLLYEVLTSTNADPVTVLNGLGLNRPESELPTAFSLRQRHAQDAASADPYFQGSTFAVNWLLGEQDKTPGTHQQWRYGRRPWADVVGVEHYVCQARARSGAHREAFSGARDTLAWALDWEIEGF